MVELDESRPDAAAQTQARPLDEGVIGHLDPPAFSRIRAQGRAGSPSAIAQNYDAGRPLKN
jgi:hypothetical protein